MASFMEVLQTSHRSQNFSTIAHWQFISSNIIMQGRYYKEIQRVIDTINDGTLYLRGPVRIGIRILCDREKGTGMQISRLYSADHGVAFPCRSLDYRG